MELFKIIGVFIVIIILLGKKISLNIVMPVASVLLGILFLTPPLDFGAAFITGMFGWSTIELVLIMYSIMVLEEIMKKQGYMERMLKAMDNLFHSRRVNISLLPMLVGFLPSAGGALFSAPMIEEAAQGTKLSGEEKTFLNTLYRHIMELFFPTYPSIIFAAQISGLPLSRLIMVMFPLGVLVFIIGLWFLRKLPKEQKQSSAKGKRFKLFMALMATLWPLLLLITIIMVTPLPIYLACLGTIILLLIVEKIKPAQIPHLIKEATNLKVIVMVTFVMAFVEILVLCGLMEIVPQTISQLPIPSFVVFALMAYFISAISGMTIAASAITLPLALATATDANLLPLTALIIASAYCGVMVTPVHLCIIIVADYFKANLQKILITSVITYTLLFAFIVGLYFIIDNVIIG